MEHVSREPLPHEAVANYALLGGEDARRGQRLFQTGVVLTIAAVLYLCYSSNVGDVVHLALGLTIFVLSALPSLFWARSGGSRFPVFEMITLFCANAYAMPLLNARDQLYLYSDSTITRAGSTVVLYLLSAIVVYLRTTGLPGRTRFWLESLITDQVERRLVYGILISTLYAYVATFTTWIPRELESILRAVFFGIGILCSFISAQRWGRGELTNAEKGLFLGALILQMIFMSVGLILIAAISLGGLALLGYMSGGRRVPWVAIIGGFLVIAVLHTGKTRMREKYWYEFNPPPTITQLPAYFAEWVDYGTQPTSGGKTVGQKMIERTSLMHMLCLIVDWTPARQDYLYGRTYTYVLPQLVPRFFWPEKPRSHIATYDLSIYYGLQAEEDTTNTTIAFGLLAEAYANFGLLGSILLGAFWGFVLRKLQIWSTFSPIFSFAGLFMIILTAWSLNAELTMAAWVSSFEQAVIVVLGVPMLIRGLLGG
jgi:hypothetical protein